MAVDFNAWNKEFGGKEALEALNEAKKNEYQEVPDGKYEVKLEKLELAESKNGKPMVKGMFRILQGQYKKQCLFFNQVFTRGFPQHKALQFLRSLRIFEDSEVDFDGDFNDFNDLLLDMAEEAEAAAIYYEVEKSHDGEYTRLEVTDVFE